MDASRFLGAAVVVGIIGPLFWLGVNVLEVRLRGLLRKKIAERKARRAAADLRSPPRIAE